MSAEIKLNEVKSEEIRKQTEEYLANGGVIQQIPKDKTKEFDKI